VHSDLNSRQTLRQHGRVHNLVFNERFPDTHLMIIKRRRRLLMVEKVIMVDDASTDVDHRRECDRKSRICRESDHLADRLPQTHELDAGRCILGQAGERELHTAGATSLAQLPAELLQATIAEMDVERAASLTRLLEAA
jgi:hypothetical protein